MGYTVLEAKAFDEAEVEERWAAFWERHVARMGWTPPEREEAEGQLRAVIYSSQGWEPKNALLACEAVDATYIDDDGESYHFSDFMAVLTSPEALVNARVRFDYSASGEMPHSVLAQDVITMSLREALRVEQMTCGHLHKLTRGEDGKMSYVAVGRFRLPVCQRDFVWSENESAKFIDSLWRGFTPGNLTATEIRRPPVEAADIWGISPTTLAATSNMLIDGQQRATSLLRYVSDKYPVYGKYFSELPEDKQDEFLSRSIAVSTIKAIDFADLMELYDRMNAGGKAHADTERAIEATLRNIGRGVLEFEFLDNGDVAVYVPDVGVEVVMPQNEAGVAFSVNESVMSQYADDAAAAELLDDPS